jgi:hypothetical protein
MSEPQTGREYGNRAVTLSRMRLGGRLLNETQWAVLHRPDAAHGLRQGSRTVSAPIGRYVKFVSTTRQTPEKQLLSLRSHCRGLGLGYHRVVDGSRAPRRSDKLCTRSKRPSAPVS